LAAVTTATLMFTDIWFDLCTSPPGSSFAYAIAEAAAELLVAGACLAIGLKSSGVRWSRSSVGNVIHALPLPRGSSATCSARRREGAP
jgi:hypothetical protein